MDTAPAAQEESASHCLWVDKFTPQRYMELLSDDVRCWDKGGGLGMGGVMPWDQELPLEALAEGAVSVLLCLGAVPSPWELGMADLLWRLGMFWQMNLWNVTKTRQKRLRGF